MIQTIQIVINNNEYHYQCSISIKVLNITKYNSIKIYIVRVYTNF